MISRCWPDAIWRDDWAGSLVIPPVDRHLIFISAGHASPFAGTIGLLRNGSSGFFGGTTIFQRVCRFSHSICEKRYFLSDA